MRRSEPESAESPVNFAAWAPQNGNASTKPGAGLKDSPAADSKVADQLSSQPLALGERELLRRGSEGDKVRQVQSMLNKHGGANLEVDGSMGRQTGRAVRKLQRQNGLRPDGVVGPKTQAVLNRLQADAGKKQAQEAQGAQKAAEVAGGAQTAPPVKSPDQSVQGVPPARPQGGTPVDLGRLSTLQGAQRNADGSYSFRAGATIDVDGSGPKYGDPYAQNQTSLGLRGPNGQRTYPNADKVPYFVLPPQVASRMGAKPGDLGLISYQGKTVPAVFADQGPKHRIGELSRKAALDLGIPASPISGGVGSGVDYRVFPGSRTKGAPTAGDITPERLQQRVQQLLKQDQESRAGEVAASTQGQAPPVGQTQPVGQAPPSNQVQGAGSVQRPNPVPVPNGLREIMKTFGAAGSQNLRRVTAPAGPGGKEIPVAFHTKIADNFKAAFEEVKRQGLSGEIQSFDGAFNNRSKRGGHSKSTHAWGISFDLNAGRYPFGTRPESTSANFKKIAEILKSYGFQQLSKDAHHFQYATGY